MTKNPWALSAMIAENFEITCLKLRKSHMRTSKASVTNENFIFFSSFIFVFVNLGFKSTEMKCYQKWLNNEDKQRG